MRLGAGGQGQIGIRCLRHAAKSVDETSGSVKKLCAAQAASSVKGTQLPFSFLRNAPATPGIFSFSCVGGVVVRLELQNKLQQLIFQRPLLLVVQESAAV
jgi:hypothetical protein